MRAPANFESDCRRWSPSNPGRESVFSWEAPPVRFGRGATAEVGAALSALGARRALVVTDRGLRATGLPDKVRALVENAGVAATVWDGAQVEPTDTSLRAALSELASERFDAFVGVGGGSSIDTCKGVNLLISHPAEELAVYLAPPHGEGRPIPGALKPMIGVPTTAGTGSECSAVAVFNLEQLHVKGALSNPRLRPRLAVVDPDNTLTCPPLVTASAGYDALVQTLESYTCRPFNERARPPEPTQRALYAGATPISDTWSERALGLIGRYFRRAVASPGDIEARYGMSLAALFSRLGTAGSHLPHAAAYAIAGMVREYRPLEFGSGPALVPHGLSVVATAAAAFDYTCASSPERHDRALRLLTVSDPAGTAPSTLGEWLRSLIAETGGPRGIDEFGFGAADVPDLVAATSTQTRLLVGCPSPTDDEALSNVFQASFSPAVAARDEGASTPEPTGR